MQAIKFSFIAGIAAVAAVSAGQASFQGVGHLSGGLTAVSRAYAVSDNGGVVVGYSDSSVGHQAFRWTPAGGMVGIGQLASGLACKARAVSGDGTVIGGDGTTAAGSEAFRWTQAGGMVSLGDLSGGTVNSSVLGISFNGGVMVGEGRDANDQKAFRWTAASGMVNMGLLGGAGTGESHAYDVTWDGTTICGYSTDPNGKLRAFLWQASTGMVSLGDLAGGTVDSRGYGMSKNGLYVVGRSDSGFDQAFRWFNKKMTGLGLLAGHISSRARAVTLDGTIVIGRCSDDTVTPNLYTAFIWTDDGGMQNLQTYLVNHGATGLTGWHLEEAEDITPDGQYVVGHGTNASGITEGWIARLPVRLSSHTLSAPSAISGATVTGTVKISYATATARTITLSSSDTSAATVPASVTIPAGETSATYTVTTLGVATNKTPTINASFDGVTRGVPLLVKAATLKSFTASPSPLYGGQVLTGKVSLTGAAPPGGAVISLTTSNSAVIAAPASITIPFGLSSGSYSVGTPGVNTDTTVTLGASYAGLSKSVSETVKKAALASVKFSPTSVASGKNSSYSVTLLGQAGPGGRVIPLTVSNPALLTAPSSITVPQGTSTAKVTVTSAAVATNSSVGVTATDGGVSKSATLTILAPVLTGVTLKAATATGGTSVGGTVVLSGYAPSGGITVTLSSSDTSVATVPASVTVLAGKLNAAFTVTTSAVGTTKTVTVTATYNGVSKQVTLTVNP